MISAKVMKGLAVAASVMVQFAGAVSYSGKVDLTSDIDGAALDLGKGSTTGARQNGARIYTGSNNSVWGNHESAYSVGYLMLSGYLHLSGGCYVKAPYLNFRQIGGVTSLAPRIEDSYQTEYTLRGDFVFEGDAVSTNNFTRYQAPLRIAVCDNAWVGTGGTGDAGAWMPSGAKYPSVVALNGGRLALNARGIASTAVNPYAYYFNGGELETTYGDYTLFGNPSNENVRVCEKGGGVLMQARTVSLPSMLEPRGNVVRTVELTDAVREMTWDAPPSVDITDSTGSGTNAFAVVDWDFDTGRITNITVLCCGENYTEGATTANFAYKAGDALLDTPLQCTLGTCRAVGDFTFAKELTSSDAYYFQVHGATNEWRGATIVDMDRTHVAEHGRRTTGNYPHSLAPYGDDGAYFPYTTNIIIKSGELIMASGSLNAVFPSCTRLELYGGHLARSTASFADVVVGGECWAASLRKDYTSTLTVTNTLHVYYGAVVTNGVIVTPALKYGYFTFGSGSKIAMEDWSSLPRGERVCVLDLSEMTTVSGTPTVETYEDGVLDWDATEHKLYAQRDDYLGFTVIFR